MGNDVFNRLKSWFYDPFGYREMTERLLALEIRIEELSRQLEEFSMAVSQELKDMTKKIDDATNAIAARITDLMSKITNSMTDAEKAEVLAGLQAEVDRLTALGQDPNNPVPPGH